MTAASTDDIAWVRPGKRRNNGTQQNLDRRREHVRNLRIAERAHWPRYTVSEHEIWPHRAIEELPSTSLPDPGPETPASRREREADEYELKHSVRCPPGLWDRMRAAWNEYWACQRELEKHIAEQEVLRD